MTALDHLRKLLGDGDEPLTVDSTPDGEYVCFYCLEKYTYHMNPGHHEILHAPDCPWIAAKAFVEHYDSAQAESRELINDGPIVHYRDRMVDTYVDLPGTIGRAFTLIELLVVLVIILVVSAVALPTILSALSHRQVSEGARLLQAQLAGARDAAIRDNAPHGLRLLPDPAFPIVRLADGTIDSSQPLASNRIIPIAAAPDYTEGFLTRYPGPGLPAVVGALPYPGPGTPTIPKPTYGDTSVLMVYETSGTWQKPDPKAPYVFIVNPPTSWFWNARIGDRIQIGGSSRWYTIVGPMNVTPAGGNNELFVNPGPLGTVSPLSITIPSPDGQSITSVVDFLLLVNGKDDNGNGLVDEGWNGRDDDGINGADDIGEWVETEAW